MFQKFNPYRVESLFIALDML